MKWRAPADRRVVEAVIATFCDSPERSHHRLSALQLRDWQRSYYWLDAGGMALYLLHQLETLGIEDSLPPAVLDRLRQNLADNHFRSASMFAECVALNQAFRNVGITFCNLKGFTLWPESCPSPALRCQLDLDFLVDGHQLDLCRTLLAQRGYRLLAATGTVWEFKSASSDLVRIEDHYKPTPQRSIELHFSSSPAGDPARDERLDRLERRTWNGYVFPVLSAPDQFVAQALHLFGHLCDSNTRVALLLEYKRHVAIRYDDRPFWEAVQLRAQSHCHAPIAIGLSNLLCGRIFGLEAPAQLDDWTLDLLPPTVRLWADLYGRKAVLADFPGTKLYLLLRDELARQGTSQNNSEANSWRKAKRSLLLPLHRVPRIVHPTPGDSLRKRLRSHFYQARYTLFRLRFHISQDIHYLIESYRWKRHLAALHDYTPHPVAEKPHLTKSEYP